MTSLLDPTTTSPRPTQRQETLARVLIAVYAAAALASVVVLIAKTGRRGGGSVLEQIFGTLNIPLASTPISVLVLWIMWGALSRRKRVALIAVGVFQLLGAGVSALALFRLQANGFHTPVGQGRGYLLAAQSALAVVIGLVAPFLLYRIRNAFPAKVRSSMWWKSLSVTFAGVLLSLIVSAVLLTVANIRNITDQEVFQASLMRALGFTIPRFPHEAEHTIFLISQITSALILLSICGGLYLLLRPSSREAEQDESVEERLRTHLIETASPDSLSYFSTRRDKRVFTSSDGKASLAYRIIGPVCLVSADPVGDRASWPLLASEWKSACRTYGWVPAVIGASEDGARLYLDQGLSVITLGDEAILHPDRFTLNNEAMTPVRQAVQRARRAGLAVGIHRMKDLDEEQRRSLAATVANWRTDRERGFSMALGRFNDPADADTLVVVAHNAEGEPHGLLSFVPWGRAGLSLDLMLRSPSAPNGTTELMVAELMEYGRSRGIARVSLNFAVFRSIFADADRLGASLSTRINSGVLGFLDRFTQVESLYRANDKFKPDWQPRFFLFDGVFSLPRVALAAASAEGFLPEPPWLRSRVRRPLSGEALARLSAKARELHSPDLDSVIHKPSSHTCLRLAQAERLAEGGMESFPLGAEDALPLSALTAEQWKAGGWMSLYGRAEHIRKHGGVVFIDLREGAARLQILADTSATEQFELLRRGVGTGDMLLVRGEPGLSRNGTPSLLVASWKVAAKALHPVPFRGVTDPEARLRRRSTDLLTNPAQVERLRLRSRAVHAMREVLISEGFTEVETPMLNTVHGGASARPFRTFINAYGVDLTLRIAPELQLKRLLVGGLGPVFEIGRNFRNEGADATHNPEFTALEAYQPFGDYVTMRHLTEKLIKRAALQAHGSVSLPLRSVREESSVRDDDGDASGALSLTDVSAPWPVVSVIDAVSEAVGQPVDLDTDIEVLLDLCRRHDVDFRPEMGPGALIEELYGEIVEPATVFPTFYVDFPVETSPLAGAHRTKPGLAERWDLVANGMELGTAYSELTDPVEQRRRLTEQSLKAAHGDPEAMAVDEDFLYALETGMPPAGGLGLGVDRLIMLLTGTNIRDVITFPFVRPLPRR